MRGGGLIIHLVRATERKAHVDMLIDSAPIACEVLAACDSLTMSDADRAAIYIPQGLHQPSYPFTMTHGEIACFASHRKAWQRIIDLGWDYGFIIEDDIALGPDFAATFDFAVRHLQPGTYIRMPQHRKETSARKVAGEGEKLLFEPRAVRLGMVAQVVTRDAAHALLAQTTRFDRPVDAFLQLAWLHGTPMQVVHPPVVSEISNTMGGTTIQLKKQKSLGDRLLREIKRYHYRRQIARAAKRHSVLT